MPPRLVFGQTSLNYVQRASQGVWDVCRPNWRGASVTNISPSQPIHHWTDSHPRPIFGALCMLAGFRGIFCERPRKAFKRVTLSKYVNVEFIFLGRRPVVLLNPPHPQNCKTSDLVRWQLHATWLPGQYYHTHKDAAPTPRTLGQTSIHFKLN